VAVGALQHQRLRVLFALSDEDAVGHVLCPLE
jgi:hypothetical protein